MSPPRPPRAATGGGSVDNSPMMARTKATGEGRAPGRAGAIAGRGRAVPWRRAAAVARNTFRETVRDRVLYALVLFVLLLVGAAVLLGEVSLAQDAKLIVDFGLTTLLLFGAGMAILVGVGLVTKEIERRTALAIFAKPLRRGEFLLGKYAGLCLTLAVTVIIMGAGVSLALAYVRGPRHPLLLGIWPAVVLIYLELLVVTAIALLFSTSSSPAVSALFAGALLVIGHFASNLKATAAALPGGPARAGGLALAYVLPDFSLFSAITAAAHGVLPSPGHLAGAALYATLYASVVLAAAVLLLERRDFS